VASRVVNAVVANTDHAWFYHFRPSDELKTVDEVNFWRPAAQTLFRSLAPGSAGPVFFRLKHPIGAIAGFGFFAGPARMSVSLAWEIFGEKNGDPTRERFVARIRDLREALHHGQPHPDVESEQLTSMVLRNAVFLPDRYWLRWAAAEDWGIRTQGYAGYELAQGAGVLLAEMLKLAPPAEVPDLAPAFTLVDVDDRMVAEQELVVREGQGTFRSRLITAYDGQCAVTGEHAVPVLEAAHIQRYLGIASNHIQNGLLLRADLHRLYDRGYITVTPGLRLEVSPRLRAEFHNGKPYYELAGTRVHVPGKRAEQPSRAALEWHTEHVFR
jgi:putative restriction endonuclease